MSISILRLHEVKKITGLSRSSIYNHIEKGLFTKQISIGLRAIGWPKNEVEVLLQARIAGYTNEQIKELVLSLESERSGQTTT